MGETVFDELKRYVGFTAADGEALTRLAPIVRPHVPAICDLFYARILEHPPARAVLESGERQVGHLKVTLAEWFQRLLSGPWDDAYFDLRCRIGRQHVRIQLPQHYMFGAMSVVRESLLRHAQERWLDDPEGAAVACSALNKVLDLELAIMLHTYREDLQAQQARTERLATFGQLVGSIGHELRNPLGVMETSLFILNGRLGDDERARKHAGRIGEQLKIANHIITDLLDLIRDRPLVQAPIDFRDVIAQAREAIVFPPGVIFEALGFGLLPPVMGDAHQLRQIFVNLLENAVHATEPVGRVVVTGHAAQGQVTVTVEDSGPGIDPTIRGRLFEPLITTKSKGIGLGLALVRRIVERHGGSVTSEPGGSGLSGARFVLCFPVGNR